MRIPAGLCVFFSFSLLSCQNSSGQEERTPNQLIDESSPYLLQHAYNPVNWHPWKPEVLDKAVQENKLLIISVGYSSCHWCHVMEHESFEDSTVAAVMNEHFLPIKVDREERPDIDNVYMTACQLASGRNCGWPLNAFALPDGRPVWAGTYFPKDQWLEILQYFVDLRTKDPAKLEQFATQITEGIKSVETLPVGELTEGPRTQDLQEITGKVLQRMDRVKGGSKGAPKFPMPNTQQFLLKEYHRSQNPDILASVNTTLTAMARGGIYDHLGGGFARYSTDAEWKVPHFEKMLYDNGQLVSLYAQAYQQTGNPLYRKVVEETLDFISREMTSPEGGFYSSFDADSEGEEGKFYIWEESEIDALLQDEHQALLFKNYYNVSENGNWEESNILYNTQSLEEVAGSMGLELQQAQDRITEARTRLFTARSERILPGLDDKVLTSWNALMLMGYIDAYRALQEPAYLDAALKNANFISELMLHDDFRLNRNYKDGKSVINAFLDDYALTAQAFIALYAVTFDETWLRKAEGLVEYTLRHFSAVDSVFFNFTSALDPPLIVSKQEITDNVIPASNSVMARNLHLLGLYLYNNSYLERSREMLRLVSTDIISGDYPGYYSNWCQLMSDVLNPPYEIAIIGPDYEEKRREIMSHFLPNAIFLGGSTEGTLALLKDKLQEGETYIYVCQNKVCKLPVQEVDRALDLLD